MAETILEVKDFGIEFHDHDKPERVVEHAVRGMLPKNRLGAQMYRKLNVYAGAEHPHAAQKPEVLNLK